MTIPTFGGVATRGETYAKLSYYLIECQELAAVMSHLHNTEATAKDIALSRAWLQVSENFRRLQHTLTGLATGSFQ